MAYRSCHRGVASGVMEEWNNGVCVHGVRESPAAYWRQRLGRVPSWTLYATQMFMNRITFFTKADCSLCVAALYVIRRVQNNLPFELELVDILLPENQEWFDAYRNDIPVVHLNGMEIFRHRVDEHQLRSRLQNG